MADETSTTPAPAAAAQTETPAPVGTPFEQAVAIIAKPLEPTATPAPVTEAKTESAPPAAEHAAETKPTETQTKAPDFDARLAKLIEAQKEARTLKEQAEAARKDVDERSAWLKELETDPLGALTKRGLSYEKLTEMALDPKRAQLERTDAKTMSEVEKLKAELSDLKKQAEHSKAEAVRANVLATAKGLAAQGDDYELVRTFGAEDRAIRMVEDHYAQTGQMLGGGNIDEAIKLALGQLEKAYEADIQRGLTAKKVTSKLQPVTPKPADPAAANSGQRQTPKTLTNSQAVASQPRAEPENLSVDELRAKALEILQRS